MKNVRFQKLSRGGKRIVSRDAVFPKKECPKCGRVYDGIYSICINPSCKTENNGVASVPYLKVRVRKDSYGVEKRRKGKKKRWKAKENSGLLEAPENRDADHSSPSEAQLEESGYPKV